MGLKPGVYLDTCIAIYLVEEHPLYLALLEARLAAEDVILCYSPLVELEALVLPMRHGREDLLAKFRAFFALNRRLAIPDEVYLRAAELRALHRLKTPDALHLATARYHGCAALWTNDDRLASVAGYFARNLLA